MPRNWPKPTEELKVKWLERIDDKLEDISDQVIRAKVFKMSGHLASDGRLAQAGRRCSRSPARAKL